MHKMTLYIKRKLYLAAIIAWENEMKDVQTCM